MAEFDYLQKEDFSFSIGGAQIKDVTKITLPESSVDKVEYKMTTQDGKPVYQIGAGRQKFGDCKVEFVVTPGVAQQIAQFELMVAGKLTDSVTDIIVKVLSHDHQTPHLTHNLVGVPTGISWGDLDSAGNSPLTATVTFGITAHEVVAS